MAFSTFEIVKSLAKKQGISLTFLEERLGLGKNSLYGLKRNQPSAERLQEIADYFNVSTDYLLGRTDNPNIASDTTETFSVKGRAIARKYDSFSPEERKNYDKIIAAMFEIDEEDD